MPKLVALITVLVAVTVTFIACDSGNGSHQTPTAAELSSIPQRIVVAGESLMLETYIWRDFMPISPPDGRAMIAAVSVKTLSADKFPAGIYSDSLWLFKNGDTWATTFSNEDRPGDPYVLSKVARDGPLWKPGIAVDAVVRLKDSHGNTWLLKAVNQTIHRTE